MSRLSFSSQLTVLWGIVLAVCAVLVAIVWVAVDFGVGRQQAYATQQTEATCQAIASRYELSGDQLRPAADSRDLMHALLDVVLGQVPGIEGGFWASGPGLDASPDRTPETAATQRGSFLAYAFPSYRGSGIKRDVPEAEIPLIVRTLQAVARSPAVSPVSNALAEVVVTACVVPGNAGLYAWTLTRVPPQWGMPSQRLVLGVCMVLALILAATVFLWVTLRRWRIRLIGLERALAVEAGVSSPAPIALLGEPDLDKIVTALNQRSRNLQASRAQAAELSEKLAHAERFSALGRLAAQVAHDIRNPVGAIRLRAENALAGDKLRQEKAFLAILEQVKRVDAQVSSLLALTQPISAAVESVDVNAWLAEHMAAHEPSAQAKNVALRADVALGDSPAEKCAWFDPGQLGRALDNLIENAMQHAPPQGNVTVGVSRTRHAAGEDMLRLEVIDDGPGVEIGDRERLFEPLVSRRQGGIGLGLAIVREIAIAHHGQAYLADRLSGSCFVIEIPWRNS